MTYADVFNIVKQVQYPGFEFFVGVFSPSSYYVQVRFVAEDSSKKTEVREWSGRKWHISPFMTEGEVVQTCLKAVLTAVEHEAREAFRYKDVALFQPHIHIGMLLEIAEISMVREPMKEVS